jgi:DNA-binding ferritin-like protein
MITTHAVLGHDSNRLVCGIVYDHQALDRSARGDAVEDEVHRPHFVGEDNAALIVRLHEAHKVADDLRDIGTASLIENWIDESERRVWFLFEFTRRAD